MNEVFALDHEPLAAEPGFSVLAAKLRHHAQIDSPETFNGYCQEACRLWALHSGTAGNKPSARCHELIERIERQMDGTILTSWGGVVITLHEPPHVEKHLVIRRGSYLALEKHAEKDEHLEICEGIGLLIRRQTMDTALVIEPLIPGRRVHLSPTMEHCLIGLESLLVFECSTDPKGMDQDLIFLYEPVILTRPAS